MIYLEIMGHCLGRQERVVNDVKMH